ncbi:hypothetical protein ACSSS7_001555 [Eimeria intestinalis]
MALSNNDFRQLLNEADASVLASTREQRKKQQTQQQRQPGQISAAQQRRRERYIEILKRKQQKGQKDAEGGKGGGGYRDRADERRKQKEAFYAHVAEELAELKERSGGDVEHTHLVKGLDLALLAKVRGELNKEQQRKPHADELPQDRTKGKTTLQIYDPRIRRAFYFLFDNLHPHAARFRDRLANLEMRIMTVHPPFASFFTSLTMKIGWEWGLSLPASSARDSFGNRCLSYTFHLGPGAAAAGFMPTLVRRSALLQEDDGGSREAEKPKASAAPVQLKVVKEMAEALAWHRENRKKKKEDRRELVHDRYHKALVLITRLLRGCLTTITANLSPKVQEAPVTACKEALLCFALRCVQCPGDLRVERRRQQVLRSLERVRAMLRGLHDAYWRASLYFVRSIFGGVGGFDANAVLASAQAEAATMKPRVADAKTADWIREEGEMELEDEQPTSSSVLESQGTQRTGELYTAGSYNQPLASSRALPESMGQDDDTYAECYPSYERGQLLAMAGGDSDDEDASVALQKMDPGEYRDVLNQKKVGKKLPQHFASRAEYEEYMSSIEYVPKGAFSYGRRIAGEEFDPVKLKKKKKLNPDQEWKAIEKIIAEKHKQ